MKIGIIGLGAMGSGMAPTLRRAGHDLIVHNRSRGKAEALAGEGITVADSAAEAASQTGLVLTMLANDEAVENTVFGADGVLAGLKPGQVHISCGTISVDLSKRLEEAHTALRQGFLAAPVLGRPNAAESGQLFIMAAGAAPLLEQTRPVLEALGQKLFILGDRPYQANIAKLCCNFLIFSTIEQLAEVFTVSGKGGIDTETMFELLTTSFFTAPVHKNYGRIIVDQAYEGGVPVTLGAKDNRLFLAAGEELSVPLPMASLLRDRFLATIARGEEGLDFCAIAKRVAEDAGL